MMFAGLAAFAWLLTLHPTMAAGRTYAAYDGAYVATAVLWFCNNKQMKLIEFGYSPRMKRGLFFVLALAGCASLHSENPKSATPNAASTAAFGACREFICPARVEVTLQERCVAERTAQYGRLPDPESRRAYLLQANCPEALVSGGRAANH